MSTELLRKIIHIDMDAFFAAVEQRDFPQYRNKPLIVGGLPNSRGVVATCSYEARAFGIHSVMPSSKAYRLCPSAIFVKPRFAVYRAVSEQIREIFREYTDLVEPASLDEAYLDVTTVQDFQQSATLIAQDITQKIKQRTQLTASAGISYNKFLAKIASDINKPNGFYTITPEQGPTFIKQLPIGKFHGIGRATEKKMHALGIHTGKELTMLSKEQLQSHFGKTGLHYFHIANNQDNRPVRPHRLTKSVGVEQTFSKDISDPILIEQTINRLFLAAFAKLQTKELTAMTVTIKVKYENFEQITRSKTILDRITDPSLGPYIIAELTKKTAISQRKVRLLGVTFSSLESTITSPRPKQLDLFQLN
ncbi:MAG TPA: DNA polymerase IV [Methylococcaceae bacterium]|jgi:DNA polymerase-4|nr:DNA polymerase IV [Methylococcaceae bacterium]HIN67828.1 DNA polymerase IV [Methylococcales bacterium]HIA45514.1 DNA polymerase IV [Methylococcaceae bacterium]HIB62901.1 DNA polymerase IV [Methylococcaceae bacterium]HIO12087.1 DNA polymerase IV [Methylococcales bacterium]